MGKEEGPNPWPLWGLAWHPARLWKLASGLLHVVQQALMKETARELYTEKEPWVCMVRRAAQLLCGVDFGSSQRPRVRPPPASLARFRRANA
eukprot:NODE_7948_length_410_cov_185.461972.p3 GENE.NODE_7948_length_410_cov_185.461972~~NODE_7948_length_410_cov_185.461972.p3  ORF type:complete len:92 (+),score=26.59 NODE_7948_length_410_cov_185.461972:3-278(+)